MDILIELIASFIYCPHTRTKLVVFMKYHEMVKSPKRNNHYIIILLIFLNYIGYMSCDDYLLVMLIHIFMCVFLYLCIQNESM